MYGTVPVIVSVRLPSSFYGVSYNTHYCTPSTSTGPIPARRDTSFPRFQVFFVALSGANTYILYIQTTDISHSLTRLVSSVYPLFSYFLFVVVVVVVVVNKRSIALVWNRCVNSSSVCSTAIHSCRRHPRHLRVRVLLPPLTTTATIRSRRPPLSFCEGYKSSNGMMRRRRNDAITHRRGPFPPPMTKKRRRHRPPKQSRQRRQPPTTRMS